jgi:AcrR family transcriptional regulator
MMTDHHDFKGLDKSLRIQKIIDAATDLFHRKGYRSTTLDDVSSELGITKAALYHYVSSKEKLLSIIYIQALENIFKNLYTTLEQSLPPDQKLRRIIRNHIKEIIIQSLPMFSVFFSEESQLPEEEFEKIREEKRKYTQIIEGIIEEGVSKGIFRPVDPRLQAYAILGMCNWVYKWYRPDRKHYTPDQIADHFIALLESGYLMDEADIDRLEPLASGKVPEKRESETGSETLRKMRTQCQDLLDLIDELQERSKDPNATGVPHRAPR